MRLQ
jgi:hypothetical protein